jgi:hypothetical protein
MDAGFPLQQRRIVSAMRNKCTTSRALTGYYLWDGMRANAHTKLHVKTFCIATFGHARSDQCLTVTCADVNGHSSIAINLLSIYQHAAQNHRADHQNDPRLNRFLMRVLLSKDFSKSRIFIDG